MGALASLGLASGAHCLEAGVGAGSMARWMASQVGSGGRVVGMDVSDRFFPAARGPNVELIRGDLRADRVDEDAFDFVHCRLLLLHQTPADRELVLRRLHRALRPGGWIVAFDPSFRLQLAGTGSPSEELFRRFTGAVLTSTSGRADFALGPVLSDILTQAGFSNIEKYTLFPHAVRGSRYAAYLINSIEVVAQPFVLGPGLMTSVEIDQLLDATRSGEVEIVGYPGTMAWGQRTTAQGGPTPL
jgi:ubiquinone/menaquinone biosynthesis C-methylase UbiE